MGLFSFGGNTQQDADDEQTPVRPRRSRAPEEEPMDPMLPEKKACPAQTDRGDRLGTGGGNWAADDF